MLEISWIKECALGGGILSKKRRKPGSEVPIFSDYTGDAMYKLFFHALSP